MHPMLNIAIRAIRKAGNFIIRQYEILNTINYKIHLNKHFIINFEKKITNIIIEIIHKSYPLHNFITTRNNCNYTQKNNHIQWVIDPLNNINNFIKKFPHFATSITIRIKGRTEIVVIYDPIRNELFSANRGGGALLNGCRLRCSINKNLEDTILATYFSETNKQQSIHLLNNLYIKCKDFRYTGSSLLDLAYVAVGRVDGLFATGIKPYSLIGGELIIREAGGLMSDLLGNTNYLVSGNIIAGNAKIIKEISLFFRIYLNSNLNKNQKHN
ncbi:inositol monophosphatase family protein [Blochmannia endosymbiont of Camponotus (Colobopsis) obliquus]|uniref:inositol monophosphatase family protein n=1 Tax=Blochmannia endosymbiont of Camponotus (Colobopsis) obliquus TaxID=1505597 RepID=UPI00061A53A3|nr:inositol monophosphatase family protein [Blochmannia endosymbiont of Camponotus (Colobopsis) obliquus]AKC60684.1 inositol-1-monophosphatase [Blochmannia endosymbiont of Camponotus (Colobopsis) obliquus]